MKSAAQRYISYGDDGQLLLSLPTTFMGGYDRAETCTMVRELSDYYKRRIMRLMDVIAEQERELSELKSGR